MFCRIILPAIDGIGLSHRNMDEDIAFFNKTAMFNETLRQQGLADFIDALQGRNTIVKYSRQYRDKSLYIYEICKSIEKRTRSGIGPLAQAAVRVRGLREQDRQRHQCRCDFGKVCRPPSLRSDKVCYKMAVSAVKTKQNNLLSFYKNQ